MEDTNYIRDHVYPIHEDCYSKNTIAEDTFDGCANAAYEARESFYYIRYIIPVSLPSISIRLIWNACKFWVFVANKRGYK